MSSKAKAYAMLFALSLIMASCTAEMTMTPIAVKGTYAVRSV